LVISIGTYWWLVESARFALHVKLLHNRRTFYLFGLMYGGLAVTWTWSLTYDLVGWGRSDGVTPDMVRKDGLLSVVMLPISNFSKGAVPTLALALIAILPHGSGKVVISLS
jgi:hypothetical protein